ncbi:sigma-70 family RNA polymerase sigma factor [Azospirillum cavernae]|uniref:Sigma-70 family RNA polymerase sigma factor n=1 Tax=Azospirillum cavernae TaxID=2320860 RepID=A0A418VUV8_9PROT|nr:sigma-70 family RNA polymerase sigma factor [Azospirillum cavernae]RJF80929.1 sigma-70 family RNA polymerase sigma factor [Azospirillum cavernae]
MLNPTLSRMARLAMAAALLTAEEEPGLIAAAQSGDRRAIDCVIRSHMRMAVKAATNYRHYGQPLDDLFQAGCSGLVMALNRFDPKHGVRFATYAQWYVRAEVQEFVFRNTSLVRLATTAAARTLFFRMRAERSRIEAAMPGASVGAVNQALAAHFGVSVGEVERLAAALDVGDWSLDTPVSEDGDLRHVDVLADDRPDPETAFLEANDGAVLLRRLRSAVEALPERDQVIVGRRVLADDPTTLEAMGAELGLSKERIRQLEKRAITRVAASMAQEMA